MYKNCCFTGHRTIKITGELTRLLEKKLSQLIEQGVTDFYAGGAIGWDTLCAQTVIRLRREYPQIKLHLVLPCPEAEQTAKWKGTQKEEYRQILRRLHEKT